MTPIPQETHVALLAGGTSGEREISLASGAGASAALREAGYVVTELDPARPEDLVALIEGSFDVAFLCMHGKGGEDGTLQGLLEVIGLPYTGPGVWSSATSIDKAKSKDCYIRAGIPTPKSATVWSYMPRETALQAAQTVGCPCVAKPATEGSALGVVIVEDPSGIDAALDEAFALDNEVLVERYIAGREITVAVLGNRELKALPVIEIIPRNDFYDFDAKYAPGGSQHICPAEFDDAITAEVQRLAIAAHEALECRGMSRTDMIVDEDGAAWVLETNTIPGMTPTSLLPDAAKAAGMTFPELCSELIGYALED